MVKLVMHLAYLNGIGQHAEHVQVVTAADVAAQPHVQSFIEEVTHGSHTRRQVEVGCRAMGHHDAVALHHFQFLARCPDAMCHYGRCLPEKPIAVIGIAIASALPFQLLHPSNLRRVLRQMRLNGQLVFVGQFATGLQQLGCTRWHETRCDDGTHQCIGLVELCNQPFVALHGRLHVFREIVRAVAVHGHLAYPCAHT